MNFTRLIFLFAMQVVQRNGIMVNVVYKIEKDDKTKNRIQSSIHDFFNQL